MGRLAIKLLGGFQVSLGEQQLNEIVSDRGRALLAYLALEADRSHRREAVAEMLWPNQPHPAGRANLRQTLYRLRNYLNEPGTSPPVLLITHRELHFNGNSDCWLDVTEFSQLLEAVYAHHSADLILCEVCSRHLQQAADLYRGDLLAGFSLPSCPDFDWWLLAKVEKYHRRAIIMLDRLVIHLKHNGDYSNASKYAQRAIELEPWRERSHRMKMRALALDGNAVAAFRQYETCRMILAAEMEMEPSLKTKTLLEQIRLGCLHSLSNLEGEYLLMEPLSV